MTYEEMKQWVDSATYEMLLFKWRDSPFDDPFFRREMGSITSRK